MRHSVFDLIHYVKNDLLRSGIRCCRLVCCKMRVALSSMTSGFSWSTKACWNISSPVPSTSLYSSMSLVYL